MLRGDNFFIEPFVKIIFNGFFAFLKVLFGIFLKNAYQDIHCSLLPFTVL